MVHYAGAARVCRLLDLEISCLTNEIILLDLTGTNMDTISFRPSFCRRTRVTTSKGKHGLKQPEGWRLGDGGTPTKSKGGGRLSGKFPAVSWRLFFNWFEAHFAQAMGSQEVSSDAVTQITSGLRHINSALLQSVREAGEGRSRPPATFSWPCGFHPHFPSFWTYSYMLHHLDGFFVFSAQST